MTDSIIMIKINTLTSTNIKLCKTVQKIGSSNCTTLNHDGGLSINKSIDGT